jgi:hypothetical protein
MTQSCINSPSYNKQQDKKKSTNYNQVHYNYKEDPRKKIRKAIQSFPSSSSPSRCQEQRHRWHNHLGRHNRRCTVASLDRRKHSRCPFEDGLPSFGGKDGGGVEDTPTHAMVALRPEESAGGRVASPRADPASTPTARAASTMRSPSDGVTPAQSSRHGRARRRRGRLFR